MSYISKDFKGFVEQSRFVMLSGGFGTQLPELGAKLQPGAWSGTANLDNFEIVRELHQQFMRARAVGFSTNSFRTDPTHLEQFLVGRRNELNGEFRAYAQGLTSRYGLGHVDLESTNSLKILAERLATAASEKAVEACHRVTASAHDRPAFTLLSYGPHGDTHSYDADKYIPPEKLEAIHLHQALTLSRLGGDALLPETIPSLREAIAMSEAARKAARQIGKPNLPYVASLCLNPATGKLWDDTSVPDAIQAILGGKGFLGWNKHSQPLAILINCTPSDAMREGLLHILGHNTFKGFTGVYANGGGHPHSDGRQWCFDHAPQTVGSFVDTNLAFAELDTRVKFFGGCCGASPHYIAALRGALDARYPEQAPFERDFQAEIRRLHREADGYVVRG